MSIIEVLSIMDRLQDSLCFKLGSSARSMQKQYNAHCAEYGITIAQSFILFLLLAEDGLNPKTLAEQLEIDGSAITGLVDRLEKESLVERKTGRSAYSSPEKAGARPSRSCQPRWRSTTG